jgi:hypothetical protein
MALRARPLSGARQVPAETDVYNTLEGPALAQVVTSSPLLRPRHTASHAMLSLHIIPRQHCISCHVISAFHATSSLHIVPRQHRISCHNVIITASHATSSLTLEDPTLTQVRPAARAHRPPML